MNLDIEIKEHSFTARDGMPVVVVAVLWQGQVTEVNTYRASDMAPIQVKTLIVKGAH